MGDKLEIIFSVDHEAKLVYFEKYDFAGELIFCDRQSLPYATDIKIEDAARSLWTTFAETLDQK